MPPYCNAEACLRLCNMRCRYCFTRMRWPTVPPKATASWQDTLEAIIKRVLAFAEGSCNFIIRAASPP